VSPVNARNAAREALGVRQMYVELKLDVPDEAAETASELEADARTRTADPFITSKGLVVTTCDIARRELASLQAVPAAARAVCVVA
jgi:hypothetical protein